MVAGVVPLVIADVLTVFSAGRCRRDKLDPAQLNDAVVEEAGVVHHPSGRGDRRSGREHRAAPPAGVTARDLEKLGPVGNEVTTGLVVVALT